MSGLKPWIANPPNTFNGATQFTQPAWPVVTEPMKTKAPGNYAITTPTLSGGSGPLNPWPEVPAAEKSNGPVQNGQYRGRRVSPTQPSPLRLTKRVIVP